MFLFKTEILAIISYFTIIKFVSLFLLPSVKLYISDIDYKIIYFYPVEIMENMLKKIETDISVFIYLYN